MNQNLNLKTLFFSTMISICGVIIGVLLCRNSHKEQSNIIYDINHIADSINAANAHSDTIIKELKGEIKYEKGKLTKKFIAIDSLSFDSSYKLWEQSARQYKAYVN